MGKVYLVGAGPGNIDYLTVRAQQLLLHAEVLIYDALVDERLLTLVPPNCIKFDMGKRGGRSSPSQSEINQLMVEQCRLGKQVVRLKSGDPFIFGRATSELLALLEANCPFEVVPGISSALAAPLLAGIPLTDTVLSRCFAVVSAHEPSELDWEALARLETLVILMGTRHLREIVKQLQRYGRSPSSPIAVIRDCGRPEQQVWVGTLKDIVGKTTGVSLSPAVFVIGEVVGLRDYLRSPSVQQALLPSKPEAIPPQEVVSREPLNLEPSEALNADTEPAEEISSQSQTFRNSQQDADIPPVETESNTTPQILQFPLWDANSDRKERRTQDAPSVIPDSVTRSNPPKGEDSWRGQPLNTSVNPLPETDSPENLPPVNLQPINFSNLPPVNLQPINFSNLQPSTPTDSNLQPVNLQPSTPTDSNLPPVNVQPSTPTQPFPLTDKTILVTRSAGQSSQFSDLLQQQGARVIEMPALVITPPSSWDELDNAIARLYDFDWLILTSSNGVDYFFERLHVQGKNVRSLSTLQIAVVGKKTAASLKSYGRVPDFTPPNFVADSLIEQFPEPLEGRTILFPRVESGGRDILVKELTARGAEVTEVAAYESGCPTQMEPAALEALQQQRVDVITFGSSKTVKHFVHLLETFLPGDSQPFLTAQSRLQNICIASIGPQTSSTCRQLLGRVDVEAQEYTLEGLTQAIVQWATDKRGAIRHNT